MMKYGREGITERDLPHRTKITQLIIEKYKVEYKRCIEDMKNVSSLLLFLF